MLVFSQLTYETPLFVGENGPPLCNDFIAQSTQVYTPYRYEFKLMISKEETHVTDEGFMEDVEIVMDIVMLTIS